MSLRVDPIDLSDFKTSAAEIDRDLEAICCQRPLRAIGGKIIQHFGTINTVPRIGLVIPSLCRRRISGAFLTNSCARSRFVEPSRIRRTFSNSTFFKRVPRYRQGSPKWRRRTAILFYLCFAQDVLGEPAAIGDEFLIVLEAPQLAGQFTTSPIGGISSSSPLLCRRLPHDADRDLLVKHAAADPGKTCRHGFSCFSVGIRAVPFFVAVQDDADIELAVDLDRRDGRAGHGSLVGARIERARSPDEGLFVGPGAVRLPHLQVSLGVWRVFWQQPRG